MTENNFIFFKDLSVGHIVHIGVSETRNIIDLVCNAIHQYSFPMPYTHVISNTV